MDMVGGSAEFRFVANCIQMRIQRPPSGGLWALIGLARTLVAFAALFLGVGLVTASALRRAAVEIAR
jgi:hypothetical protein